MRHVIVYLVFAVSLVSCGGNSGYKQYKDLEAKEIKRHVREDSLFFGIYLGMTSQNFYAHCWEMNKKGLFTDGLSNTAVLYKVDSTELGHPASMNFYPVFYNNTIASMQAVYQYDGWAPWNKYLFSDSLLMNVLKMYKKWYSTGNPFIKIKDEKRGVIYVKVDGNRRIILGTPDESRVRVDYTDLFVEKAVNEQGKNQKSDQKK
ncbi:MAG: hypothetical protein QM764_04865 [Chitinophagaceae bacterium]